MLHLIQIIKCIDGSSGLGIYIKQWTASTLIGAQKTLQLMLGVLSRVEKRLKIVRICTMRSCEHHQILKYVKYEFCHTYQVPA